MSRWFRHYAGMMRDDKLVRVALQSKQSVERVLWIWGAILENAAELNDGGRFDVDQAEIAYFLQADEADIRAVFDGLAAVQRVSGDCVVHWGSRQFESDRSANRQAAYRERKRSQESNTDVTNKQSDGQVTSPEGFFAPASYRMPSHEWAIVRKRIFERDDYTCAYCGERGGRLECDHIRPVSKGGDDTDGNLVAACFPCNRSKRDRLLSEWQQ